MISLQFGFQTKPQKVFLFWTSKWEFDSKGYVVSKVYCIEEKKLRIAIVYIVCLHFCQWDKCIQTYLDAYL